MKPLNSIDTPEPGLGSAGNLACPIGRLRFQKAELRSRSSRLSRRLTTSRSAGA